MKAILIVIAVVATYFVLNMWVLPMLGINT